MIKLTELLSKNIPLIDTTTEEQAESGQLSFSRSWTVEEMAIIADIYIYSTSERWEIIREYRNKLLALCDRTQLPDAPLTAEQRAAWAEYRQALRDIPQMFEVGEGLA